MNAALSLAVGGAVLGSVPAIVGARHWLLDNLASASLHLLIVLSTLALVAGLRRRVRTAVVAAITAGLLAYRVVPALGSAGASQAAVASMLVANVYTANTEHARLAALIREHKPDIIGLIETDARWLRALEPELTAYPHRVLHPRDDNFGMALYARVPLHGAGLRDFGIGPTITATVKLEHWEADLVLVHVLPPLSSEHARLRNEQLSRIGALRPRPGKGLVIAGDLNVTPYSMVFRGAFAQPPFERAGGLTGTFPAQLPALLRVPIDHVLTAGTATARVTVERAIGSDHLPLMVELGARGRYAGGMNATDEDL